MGASRTKTVKNKHASTSSSKATSSKGSKKGGSGGSSGGSSSTLSGASKVRKSGAKTGATPSKQVKDRGASGLHKRPKKKVYSAESLGIPELNTVTPVGVIKPRGKKKGKIFVDDQESMNTIFAMVQAEKTGQIESKMIKARQMEEIREARKAEAEKKDQERKSRLEDTKDSLRKKRKRKSETDVDDLNTKAVTATGTKATKSRKRVSFA